MKNNKSSLTLRAVIVASSMVASAAFASDGTITINGTITGNTCTVTGSGVNGDVTVDLEKTAASALSTAGQTAAFKPFNITLSNCDDAATGAVKAGFEPGPTTDLTTGRLNLLGAADVASNVQLQLRNSDSSVIKIGDNNTIKGADISGKSAVLTYQVGYYATGVATAGSANSQVTYSVIYQ
ncbi:fimbrial protein [Aeromonas salmonicida]|uniref:fimbrial protein n=1 Tax=Aeromonas salmonicida TaxID=645 RepID=UPI000DE58410|nr:fimbrial protein [Aeromonas salmonicida]